MSKSCNLCPHSCFIAEGETGICGIRQNSLGTLLPVNYGIVSSIAVDPIEKKPLKKFHPGRPILSIGGFGCNFRCPFCQNHELLFVENTKGRVFAPEEIAELAKTIENNIGIAYTYNEPLINYEFLLDTAKKIHGCGLKNVLVTNGFINPQPLEELIPHIDAANIDLKAFTNGFYENCGGRLAPVLETINATYKHWHIEVTTLIIPGENEDIEPLAKWLGSLDAEIPLHITRFFPRHKYAARNPTPIETVFRQVDVARKYLKHVFAGNC